MLNASSFFFALQARMMHGMKHPVLTSKISNRYQANAHGRNADTHTCNEVNEGEGQSQEGRRWGARYADSRYALHKRFAYAILSSV